MGTGHVFFCISCREEVKAMSRQCEKCEDFLCIVPACIAKNSTKKKIGVKELLESAPEGKNVRNFEFLGKLPKSFSFCVYGDPGAGKSRASLLLAGSLPGKTLYISSEQEIFSGSFRTMVKFVTEQSDRQIDIDFSNAYTKESFLSQCLGYDNVVLDSISAINAMIRKRSERINVADMRELKSRLKVFGYLLHSTKKKSYQGETWLTHEPDIVMKVSKFAKIIVTKNRFDIARKESLFQDKKNTNKCTENRLKIPEQDTDQQEASGHS